MWQFWSKNIVASSAKGIEIIIAINVPKSLPNIALSPSKFLYLVIQCVYIINPNPKAFIAGREFINNTIPIPAKIIKQINAEIFVIFLNKDSINSALKFL